MDINQCNHSGASHLHGPNKSTSEEVDSELIAFQDNNMSSSFENRCSNLYTPADKIKLFDLVCRGASEQQWADWLRLPLEYGAAAGEVDLVKTLIKAGAKVDADWRGCDGRTMLHAAVQGGRHETVSVLLRAGAKSGINVSCDREKWTALHYASYSGHETIVEILMFAGADISCTDAHEDTPLHLAAREGYRQVVIGLALRGADVNKLNRSRFSPLFLASIRGHVSTTEALLTAGVDAGLRCGVNPRTALEEAACKGHVSVMRALIQHGVDVNAGDPNDHGATALHLAAYFNHPNAVDMLVVEGGADLEARTTHPNGGWTPISYAAKQNSCDALLALLRHKAKVDPEGASSNPPLAMACQWLAVGAAEILLRWGADERYIDIGGRSASDMVGTNLPLTDQDNRKQEITSLKKTLERTPMDRAWRRRGMLVLCRALRDNVLLGGESDNEIDGGVSQAASGRRAAKCTRTVKIEVRKASADNGAARGVANGEFAGEYSGGYVSDSLEARVVKLGEESVFRRIVCFL